MARLTAIGLAASAIAEAIAAARQTGYRLLYVVAVPADEIVSEALRQAGAWFADQKVTYLMPLLPAMVGPVSTAIGDAAGYTSQLESLAWQSGEYSRFRLDSRLAPGVFQQLYSCWLHNSLTGSIARRVLVWRDPSGQEVGLLILGEKNDRADIGLLAVDAAARGQRVGQQLVAAARNQALAWGYTSLQVVTQGSNLPACRFYEKCGFNLEIREHIYHVWLD